ncbi:hypothetical protein CYY_006190 [Polysphondylium violaceum]|uniref:EGF-like domain-containing protein n=1 Tax=Polysphondylium violaceum TaxID=133409 RepID=A0A8J4PRR6_9MYCE|nr:hypothetical protein CYY_006190 [Polysphondylium violaceum]
MNLLLILFSLVLLNITNGQSITGTSPSFIRGGNTQLPYFDILGNFQAGTTVTIVANDKTFAVAVADPDAIYSVQLPIFDPPVYSVFLRLAGESQGYILACAYLDNNGFTQDNDMGYITGKGFKYLPGATAYIKDNVVASYHPITVHNDTTLSFKVVPKMGSTLSLYDSWGIVVIVTLAQTVNYNPIIMDIKYYESSFAIYSSVILVSITFNGYQCSITGEVIDEDVYNIACIPAVEILGLEEEFTVVAKDVSGRTTTIVRSFPSKISNTSTDVNGNSILHGSFAPLPTGFKIVGIYSTPLTSISNTSDTIAFNTPDDISCGYVYILANGERITNQVLYCPTPQIVTYNVSNNVFYAVGKYMTGNNFDTFNLQIESSDHPSTCTFKSMVDYTYEIICALNPNFRSAVFVGAFQISGQNIRLNLNNNPTINSISPIIYQKPGIVTIFGRFLKPYYQSGSTEVKIAGSSCSNIVINSDSEIQCLYQSDVPMTNLFEPLEVFYKVEYYFSYSSKLLTYSCPTASSVACTGNGQCELNSICVCTLPWYGDNCSSIDATISSITSTKYGVASQVTITGTNFLPPNIFVTIGGSECESPVAVNTTMISCFFRSNVAADPDTKLQVVVNIGIGNSFKATIFSYLTCVRGRNNNKVCSGHGSCSSDLVCNCEKGWEQSDCSIINPSLTSITSTKYKAPGQVTILGNNFSNYNLMVKIGGSVCTNAIASSDAKSITCLYQSDVATNGENDLLSVYVSIDIYTVAKDLFLYTKPGLTCPNNNNQECSGHGTCNQQQLCICEKGWTNSDCSIKDIGVVIDDPIVNENDTSTTIITPSGTKFDIGLIMVNELNTNNDIIHSFNLNKTNWTQNNDKSLYTATLTNNSTLKVQLTINSLDQYLYYDFAGDTLPILPKSIKYQIELQNWSFGSTQNTLEFIFKSHISESNNECLDSTTAKTSTTSNTGDSNLRSIQMTLNGETLIGTFSDRIVLDSRPTYNKVNQISNERIVLYQLDKSNVYTSIQTSYFKNSVVVDPNFGVLVSSAPDECSNNNGTASWKIAVAVVCSVVGASIIGAAVFMFLKKNSRGKIILLKLKEIKR